MTMQSTETSSVPQFFQKRQAIRYPFARGAAGNAISIEDYAGSTVTCFGCDRVLIGRRKSMAPRSGRTSLTKWTSTATAARRRPCIV